MTSDLRKKLIDQYKDGYRVVAEALMGAKNEDLDARPAPGKWTAREVFWHIADVEVGTGFRVRQIASAQGPHVIQPFDPDLWAKPYGALPGYCRAFDVGIIPFRVNTLTVRANPLKLREYLAAGLPVVSTPLPEVARYNGLVGLADSVEGFLAAIEAALGQRSEAMARRRVEAMQDESWAARVEEISALIGGTRGAAA